MTDLSRCFSIKKFTICSLDFPENLLHNKNSQEACSMAVCVSGSYSPFSNRGYCLTLLLNGISPSLAAANVRLGDIPFFLCIYFTIPVKSFTTSPAIIKPATEGTKATEPGIARRSVHLCSAPGGQMQFSRQLFSISSFGVSGSSFE